MTLMRININSDEPNANGRPLELIPLRVLGPGERGRVAQLLGRADQRHRLEELGLRVGVDIEMLQTGSACILRLGNARFCFRDTDECSVLVERTLSA